MTEKRAVCLNCIDGRVQLPVIQWIKDYCQIDYVDMVTEPGMDGLLADPKNSLEAVLRKVEISIRVNNACWIFVIGHHDCRGNPVNESAHREQILLAVERLKKEFSGMPVVGLWVNEKWQGEKL